jgi:hypothetical protein
MSAVAQAAVAKMWTEIREKFETTPASIRDLAREFGIKSHTTVLRRVQNENWTKQQAPIAAHIATEGIISEVLHASAPAASAGRGAGTVPAIESPKPEPDEAQKTAELNHHSTSKNQEISSVVSEKPKLGRPLGGMSAETAAEQRGTVRAAERMALVHQRQALLEIELADQALHLSGRVMQVLQTVIDTEDLGEAQRLINRFGAFGEDTESFSGLLRTAIMGIEKGVNLRRRAIGMEVRMGRNTSIETTPITSADLPEQVREMLPNLSTEELVELRKAAVLMGKKLEAAAPVEAQNTIEGLAEAILERENGS